MMRLLVTFFLVFLNFNAFSGVKREDLKNFYSKVYNLKSKGVTDLVFEVSSSVITKNLNESKVLGDVDSVVFRVYWTLQPERIFIEVKGIPDGFIELRDRLTSSLLPLIEEVLPTDFDRKFEKFSEVPSKDMNSVRLKDSTNLNSIESYLFKFETENKLAEIKLEKPVGEIAILPKYSKTSFSDSRWVLEEEKTIIKEGGALSVSTKEYTYKSFDGVFALSKISLVSKVELIGNKNESNVVKDEIEFSNYKINKGEGLKFFLSEFKRNKPE